MTCRKITISLILLLLSVVTFAQDTITSVANGNWFYPFTWDCNCFPDTNNVIIVDHAVILNIDWAISSGSITVNPGASLIENISGRIFYQSGGTFLNNGTVDISNIASIGGTFTNNDSLRINAALYNTANFINNGIIADVDSFTNAGVFTNNANAKLNAHNFLTTYTCSNSGTIRVTNCINDGNFTNDQKIIFINFYNSGSFQNYAGGKINAYDFWNVGSFQIDSNSTFNTSHDFLNGDTIFPNYNAVFINDGFVGVGNDWYNSVSIKGTTGQFCIKNNTYNFGAMTGSFDFCDDSTPLPPYIDWNTGTINTNITFCSSPCKMVAAVSIKKISCAGFCDGQAIVAPFGGTQPYTFSWSNNETTDTINGLCKGVYTGTIIDSALDTITASIFIAQPSVIVLTTSSTEATCGNANGRAGANVSGGIPGYTYSWNDPDNQTDSAATGLSTGTYTVTITDKNNCISKDSVTITKPPELVSVISTIDAGCPDIADGSAVVSVSGGVPPYTYVWNPPVGGGDSSIAKNLIKGIYLITVTDSNNCTINDSVVINVIGGDDCKKKLHIYSGITPNDDGIDDTWVIKGLEQYKPVSLIIFNRWGDVVYESDNYNNNWNGTNLEGKPLPDGVYYYVVKIPYETIKGWVSVLR